MVNSDDVDQAMGRMQSVDPSYFPVYPGGDKQFNADCRTLALQFVAERHGHWHRTDFCSIWAGPHVDLIVLQAAGPSEAWDWSARGYRELEDSWKREVSREKAEQAALKFYLEKE